MKLACPSCGKVIPGADIDLAKGMAVCRECSEVVTLTPAPAPPPVYSGQAAVRPTDFRLEERQDGATFTVSLPPVRWAQWRRIAGALWIDFILLFWAWSCIQDAIRYGSEGMGESLRPMLGVASVFVVIAAAVTYPALRAFFNRAILVVDSTGIEARMSCLPPRQRVKVALSELQSVVETERTRRGNNGRQARRWTLNLITTDRRSVPLPLDIGERDHARYLAARIDEALHVARGGAPAPLAASSLNPGFESAVRPLDLRARERQDERGFTMALRPQRAPVTALILFLLLDVLFGFGVSASWGEPGGWILGLIFAVMLALSYVLLWQVVNHTTVTLDAEWLRVRSTPIWPRGERRIAAADIEQFSDVERGRHGIWGGPQWTVKVITRKRESIALALDLPERDHARYVAARLNESLTGPRTPYRG